MLVRDVLTESDEVRLGVVDRLRVQDTVVVTDVDVLFVTVTEELMLPDVLNDIVILLEALGDQLLLSDTDALCVAVPL